MCKNSRAGSFKCKIKNGMRYTQLRGLKKVELGAGILQLGRVQFFCCLLTTFE